MKGIITIGLLLAPTFCFGAIGILQAGPGSPATLHALVYDKTGANDVQNDGAPEYVYKPTWNALKAVNKAGSEVWTFTLDPSEICPSCGTEPDSWRIEFYGFFDTEPGQRDALVHFDFNDWSSGFSWMAIGLISANSATGTLRQYIPDRSLTSAFDFDNDGFMEFVFSRNDGDPTYSWEMWGYESVTNVPGVEALKSSIDLMPNSPNPFNPSTKILFTLHQAGLVRFEFFDSAGRRVEVADLGHLSSGPHEYTWTGRHRGGHQFPSGTYFYSIVSGGERQSRKMLLLK